MQKNDWKDARPNRLIREVSPYLLQHAYNPVDWYAWGEEAFEKAKKDNKLVIISIGYSSCHWCHVMEHESFTNEHVARIMNERYVCIKVDREERPDIDQIYMNAVQIITRRGGWPLNCFALPDGKPVYGGTYFPTESWVNLLESLDETWKAEPQRIYEVAEELSQGIANTEIVRSKLDPQLVDFKETLLHNLNSCKRQLDFKLGGTSGAPKFPMPGLLKYLLTSGQHSQDKELLNFVFTTLERMAYGGIYDHVGGGFFRYSVDDKWFVPHFEKMLYDNAQLIEVYSLAYRLNPNPLYKSLVEQTFSFAQRQLMAPSGAFYSALDADTAGQEGGYYTWTKSELEQLLGYDSELVSVAFGITPNGNWENTNILYRALTNSQLASLFGIPEGEVAFRISSGLNKLLNARMNRVPPLVDDKVITSWNGLMISGLVTAYETFNDENFLNAAIDAGKYLAANHIATDGTTQRITCKGKTYGVGLLDDYAYLADAYFKLHKVTGQQYWLIQAEQLIRKTLSVFYDDDSGMFFYTPNGTELIVRKMELMDGVMPSATAIMVKNLFELSSLQKKHEYETLALQMLANVSNHLRSGNVYVHEWANQLLHAILPQTEVKFLKDKESFTKLMKSRLVYSKLTFVESENLPKSFLLCIGNTCQSPTDEPEDIILWVNSIQVEYY